MMMRMMSGQQTQAVAQPPSNAEATIFNAKNEAQRAKDEVHQQAKKHKAEMAERDARHKAEMSRLQQREDQADGQISSLAQGRALEIQQMQLQNKEQEANQEGIVAQIKERTHASKAQAEALRHQKATNALEIARLEQEGHSMRAVTELRKAQAEYDESVRYMNELLRHTPTTEKESDEITKSMGPVLQQVNALAEKLNELTSEQGAWDAIKARQAPSMIQRARVAMAEVNTKITHARKNRLRKEDELDEAENLVVERDRLTRELAVEEQLEMNAIGRVHGYKFTKDSGSSAQVGGKTYHGWRAEKEGEPISTDLTTRRVEIAGLEDQIDSMKQEQAQDKLVRDKLVELEMTKKKRELERDALVDERNYAQWKTQGNSMVPKGPKDGLVVNPRIGGKMYKDFKQVKGVPVQQRFKKTGAENMLLQDEISAANMELKDYQSTLDEATEYEQERKRLTRMKARTEEKRDVLKEKVEDPIFKSSRKQIIKDSIKLGDEVEDASIEEDKYKKTKDKTYALKRQNSDKEQEKDRLTLVNTQLKETKPTDDESLKSAFKENAALDVKLEQEQLVGELERKKGKAQLSLMEQTSRRQAREESDPNHAKATAKVIKTIADTEIATEQQHDLNNAQGKLFKAQVDNELAHGRIPNGAPSTESVIPRQIDEINAEIEATEQDTEAQRQRTARFNELIDDDRLVQLWPDVTRTDLTSISEFYQNQLIDGLQALKDKDHATWFSNMGTQDIGIRNVYRQYHGEDPE